jgi:hypothetical protein
VYFAVPTSPVWWMARQWLRFLTGLMIIAVALGVSQISGDERASARSVETIPVAAVEAPVSPDSDAGISIVESVVEPAAIVVLRAPAAVRQPRPAHDATPVSVDVSPVGQRAPPAVASAR